jgi:hypothetical protein
MKKFDSILAFGDSIVAGCEINSKWGEYFSLYLQGKISLEDVDQQSKPFAFPALVSNKLNIPCYNFALSGGSNDRSLRLLIREIIKYPDSLVLFGYTCTDRKEFYYPDKGKFIGRDSDNFIQTGMQWERHKHEFKKICHPINKTFVEEFSRPYNNIRDVMFCVDSICKSYSATVIHIPIFKEELPNDIENVLGFKNKTNFYEYCLDKGYQYTERWHFEQSAHDDVGQLILNYIKKF